MKKSGYALAGVDIEAGDELSAIAAKYGVATWGFSPHVKVIDQSDGGFRGTRTYQYVSLPPDVQFDSAPDGAGTKPILTAAAGNYACIGFDGIAMCVTDLSRKGMRPIMYTNQIDVRNTGKLGSKTRNAIEQIYRGVFLGCKDAGVVMWKGETAEMPHCIRSEIRRPTCAFTLSGVAHGIGDARRMITGNHLAPRQPVAAVREKGFRGNGLSAVRRGFRRHYGKEWWKVPEARADIEAAAVPSVLYERLFTDINGWGVDERVDVTFIAHLSGGGIIDKFFNDEVGRRGHSANLQALYRPTQTMIRSVEWAEVHGFERYKTFHGGQGALVVLRNARAMDAFLERAKKHDYDAKYCGEIVPTQGSVPTLTINSQYDGEKIIYRYGEK